MSTPGSYGAYPTQPGPYRGDGYPAAARGYLEGGPVGFGDAIKQAFSNGFVYRGRASRSAYWWFVLFDFIALVVLEIVVFGLAAAVRVGAVNALLFVIFGIAVIYLALVGLALTIRRLHDIDRTGWWVLIGLVPFGGIVLLVFSLLEGTPGPNRYQP
jgi:uncharacterized membrane protein YhaH (DUF805 family)